MQRTDNYIFIGRYYHALEQKGRLSIPSAFRKHLAKEAVITAGLDGCLFLLQSDRWQKLVDTASHLPLTKRQSRDWTRYLANNAAEISIDAQGRILIPESLRSLVKLKDQVVIVGSVDRIEIWDQTIYHTYLDSLIAHVGDIAESITQET